ncbi:response regulator transcription factor, partial [Pseudomonas aeruginosa]
MKSVAFTDLVEAIRTVADGGEYISPDILRILQEDPPTPTLSPRQMEILESMARGLSNTDIAKQLNISVDMVREHAT